MSALRLLPGRFAVCRLAADEAIPGWIPGWATGGPFSSVTRTAGELSIVCVEGLAPEGTKIEAGWRTFQMAGPLEFSLTGILAAIAVRLQARDAPYAAAFQALLALTDEAPAAVDPGEAEDPNDLAALDAAWEEATVRFGPGEPGDGCSTARLSLRLRADQRDARRQENVR